MRQRIFAWLEAHPWVAGLIVVVEAAAIGAVSDLLINGATFQGNWLKHGMTVVCSSVVVAVRNYLRQSPLVPKINN